MDGCICDADKVCLSHSFSRFGTLKTRSGKLAKLSGVACSLLLLSIFSGVVPVQPVHAATPAQIDAARVSGLAWLIAAHQGDGSWGEADEVKIPTTASAIEALRNSGIATGKEYGSGLTWLANSTAQSTDATSRRIVALSRSGYNVSSLADALLSFRPDGAVKSWGSYYGYSPTVIDTALALSALRNANYKYASPAAEANSLGSVVYCSILPNQHLDGGWSLMLPNSFVLASLPEKQAESSILATSLMLYELKALSAQTGWDSNTCNSITYSLSTAITNAVTYLASQQNPDGGLGANGQSTPIETALAYSALQLASPSNGALAGAQDYLLIGAGKQESDGSWQHDALSTAMVLGTLPAVVLVDTDKDGVPDQVEAALNRGTQTNVADGRSANSSNGNAQTGVTTSLFATLAYLGQPLDVSLSGGAPFSLQSGQLPPGLTLAPSGALSGTPTQLGHYSFTYADAVSETLAEVSVVVPGIPGDLNADGVVDVADVALIKRYMQGLASLPYPELADLTPAGSPDGVIDVADVNRIIRIALKLGN